MAHGFGGFHGGHGWHEAFHHHWGWQEGGWAQAQEGALGLLALESLLARGFGQLGKPGTPQPQQVADTQAPHPQQTPTG